ncbi:Ig-like domain-containing protein [candidate division KSB1 bacterium]
MLLLAVVLLFLIRCAVQVPPTGGPVDSIPPEILSEFPGNGNLNIPLDTEISITFSEKMDKVSVEKAFFISPQPDSYPEFRWKGSRLTIKYNEELITERTYVINIGAGAIDLHRIPMKESYSWAFSTGSSIDKGFVTGKIYTFEEKVKGLIWAFLMDGEQKPDPFRRKGDYITQTDEEGNFRLSFLSEGKYRIFALNDKNEDLNYSIFTDQIGIASADIDVTENDTVSGLKFQTSLIDTLPPAISLIQPIDEHHISVRFNEPLKRSSILPGNIRIEDINTNNEIRDSLTAFYQTAEDKNSILIYAQELDPGAEYRLSFSEISDEHFNRIDILADSTTIFPASALDDTVKLRLVSLFPPDSSEEIPLYSPIEFRFNHPIRYGDFTGNFSLIDSSGNRTSGAFEQISPVEINFIPEEFLRTQMPYRIRLEAENIHGSGGAPFLIDKTEFIFLTMNSRQTGALFGRLEIEGGAADSPVIVQLMQKDSEESKRRVILNSSGDFEFLAVPRGEYTLSAYLDVDGDGEWSKGRVDPFIPSEPFVIYPDILTVRPGVDNTGNNIILKIH